MDNDVLGLLVVILLVNCIIAVIVQIVSLLLEGVQLMNGRECRQLCEEIDAREGKTNAALLAEKERMLEALRKVLAFHEADFNAMSGEEINSMQADMLAEVRFALNN